MYNDDIPCNVTISWWNDSHVSVSVSLTDQFFILKSVASVCGFSSWISAGFITGVVQYWIIFSHFFKLDLLFSNWPAYFLKVPLKFVDLVTEFLRCVLYIGMGIFSSPRLVLCCIIVQEYKWYQYLIALCSKYENDWLFWLSFCVYCYLIHIFWISGRFV